MSDTEYRLARDDERADIVDFANYVFSQTHVPHDFKTLLPKVYADHLPHLGADHFVAVRDDGRIRGLVACRPVDMKYLNDHLAVGFVGTVSVHPYARGEGHMKALMNLMIQTEKDRGMDLLVLGGNRQRYNWFGFDTAGWAYHCHITKSSVRHAMRDTDASGISFAPLTGEDSDDAVFCRELAAGQPVTGLRPAGEFLDIMHSWNSECRLILSGGQRAGYVMGRVRELVLTDEDLLMPVLKALHSETGEDFTIVCPPHLTKRLGILSRIAGGVSVNGVEMIRILSWPRTLETLLRLRADFLPPEDGRFTLAVEDEANVTITVDGGTVAARETELAPDIRLSRLEAERKLFGLDTFTLGSLYKNWFPLPFWMSPADTF